MHAALGLSRLIDGVTTVIGKSVIWLIFAAILISAINAVTRKLWSLSSNSWLEAQWYLFGAAFMLGAAYTLKENEHIRIDIFYGSRSRRVQHWIDDIRAVKRRQQDGLAFRPWPDRGPQPAQVLVNGRSARVCQSYRLRPGSGSPAVP